MIGRMSLGRIETFRALHQAGDPLRLLNAWDAGSARVFELAGAPAIGTTSAGIAFALGRPDGETITRDELVAATAQIVDAVEVPVTADVESGFGAGADDVKETVRQMAAVGAVGINLEDASRNTASALRAIDDQVRRIHAARTGAELEGIDLFINARTDAYLLDVGEESAREELTLDRLSAYRDAGADGVFVPRVPSQAIAPIVEQVSIPLNVLAGPDEPSLEEFAGLGVARISAGSWPARTAIGLAAQVAGEFLVSGSIESMQESVVEYRIANAMFGD